LSEYVHEPIPIELLHLDRVHEDLLHVVGKGDQMVGAVDRHQISRRKNFAQ
jgi:hypothetical protein